MAFVIITSGIDLSIGSIVCLSGCLLALFLQVEYRSIDSLNVVQIRGEERSILVQESKTPFQQDDLIRLSGSRKSRNALLIVKRIEAVRLENAAGREAGEATLLTVEGDLSRDDDSGVIAKVRRVLSFNREPEKGASVRIDGKLDQLRPRDQITLVHPKQGQKQMEICRQPSMESKPSFN